MPGFTISGHELTSVGVGFDPSGTMVGSGDMVGNVWLTEKDGVEPLHKFSVSLGYRIYIYMHDSACGRLQKVLVYIHLQYSMQLHNQPKKL